MQTLWAPWRIDYVESEKETKCIFCTKLREHNDRKNLILHRGSKSFVMLNRYPYNNGHLMVAPLRHLKSLDDLGREELNDLMLTLQRAVALIKESLTPDGLNIGANLGKTAGAGIEDHLHFHVVPRWEGDTNCMPVLADIRVIPEHLEQTYDRLFTFFKDF
jgi:ATP adenylyltransferase